MTRTITMRASDESKINQKSIPQRNRNPQHIPEHQGHRSKQRQRCAHVTVFRIVVNHIRCIIQNGRTGKCHHRHAKKQTQLKAENRAANKSCRQFRDCLLAMCAKAAVSVQIPPPAKLRAPSPVIMPFGSRSILPQQDNLYASFRAGTLLLLFGSAVFELASKG